ncbi:MAG: hypothetical protein E5X53_13355 [Mesorhizobium sp.]|uniref:hypothetical protein n=1 Tax=Mesorhizobium sp. TaxID=1871066 RepID=UPI00121C6AC4|nr:hypothetical protein [Mesorhizobium sp.]TIP74939.1 MAG: hypothetical protein E5X55_06485 [Mesorhizobium sp.]TIQ12522.1 MAG: hypothetical protein E5X57_12595 [Mesorhizobium sp.]TIR51730.1 MAG: hypothetical protein E5X53_13355 [Mesorhizobium sp.]TJV96349.1 MAG: hypothetical protein E5X52_19125 [Mesorhizobium sp.]
MVTLSDIFGMQGEFGHITVKMAYKLIRCKKLLFATLDEHVFSFVFFSVVRSVLGKNTVALFLRPEQCFLPGKLKYRLKWLLFRALRHLPGLTIVAITPFNVVAKYAQVATAGVRDPEYWDLHDGVSVQYPKETSLSAQVRSMAGHKRLCTAIGVLNAGKGLEFLADALEQFPQIKEHTQIVVAGSANPHTRGVLKKLSDTGAIVIDRFLSDAELLSLISASELVWACYNPGYDQASGIFGRAVQLGSVPITREGAVVSRLAFEHGIPFIPVRYGITEQLAEVLIAGRSSVGDQIGPDDAEIGEWRRSFIEVINAGLAGRS